MLNLPRSAYARRRAAIFGNLPDRSAMLLPTNPERVRSRDTHYPFRPDSDFYYLCGFAEPEAWALLHKVGGQERFILFVLPKDPEKEVWHGIRAGVEGAKAEYGADDAHPVEDWDKALGALLEDVDSLYFSFGRHPAPEARLNALLSRLRQGRKASLGPSALLDPAALLSEMRLVKDEDELALMRQGATITEEAHRAAMKATRPGMREYELQALIEYTFRRRGAWGWAYPSIVGAGNNACILHYVQNDGVCRDGELLLIDAGAEVDGYATDVTRTFPVGKTFSPAQRELYSLVLASQEEAVDATVAGATIDGIHEGVVKTLSQGLLDLGLLSGRLDEVLENKSYRRYYMHRTSHWLGLDVHDVGRYQKTEGGARPLKPGMVITVEPGLYVAPDDKEAPEAFRGTGIRIEDDILVTSKAPENLTIGVPKSIDDIEALRA